MSGLNSNDKDSPTRNDTINSAKNKNSYTPVALRTRLCSQLSYESAAQLGQCKLCPASFATPQRLRIHLLSHKPNGKRKKAILAIDISCGLPKSVSSTSQPIPSCQLPALKNTLITTPTTSTMSQPLPVCLFPETSSIIDSSMLPAREEEIGDSINFPISTENSDSAENLPPSVSNCSPELGIRDMLMELISSVT
ncbi:hypothetical protein NPIL_154471 [Nephila pilipes]|uniref:C2H2-type domain-containing protein n=1 Tax=Nephila pilipes TaxID=299642 RepID=A0A8X6M742_NEPPI|nr:hypothetical protein NPIL_154471 [Nephila pilipes]